MSGVARCGDIGQPLCGACSQPIGDLTQFPGCGGPLSSPKPDTYRGWDITWDYGCFTATGPDYDASWEGEEDGWVDNGHRVSARTREEVRDEIDAWFDDQTLARGSSPSGDVL